MKAYAYEAVAIPYQFGKMIKNTVPDFLVEMISGEIHLIEVKPLWAVAKQQIKLAAMRAFAQKNGMIFRLVTENELSALPD